MRNILLKLFVGGGIWLLFYVCFAAVKDIFAVTSEQIWHALGFLGMACLVGWITEQVVD